MTEQDEQAAGRVTLTEDERRALYLILANTHLSINDCGIVIDRLATAVERILTARVAEAVAVCVEPDGHAGTLTGNLAVDMAAYAGRLKDRLETAEAKVRAAQALRDRWARLAGEAMDPDSREWLIAASNSLRAALAASTDGGTP